MSTPPFRRVIEAANSGKKFPVMQLVRDDPAMAATISKLVSPIEPAHFGTDGNRTPNPPNLAEFKTLSNRRAQDITDAQTVMQVLPEMELAAQILISSILAPKDMMTTELTYTFPEGRLAPDVAAAMIARVKQHFEQVYKIKTKLHQMLRDMLFETGSYPVAVIPENSIDEAINGPSRVTMESLADSFTAQGLVKPVGLLGPVVKRAPSLENDSLKLSLESVSFATPEPAESKMTFESQFSAPVSDSFVSVTDNFNVLKVPKLQQRLREEKILDAVHSPALEAMLPRKNAQTRHRLNDRELSSLMYKERSYSFKPIAQLKTQEELARNTVGNPLILHLPSESVIPVYVPGTVEQQIGFFVLLDMDGNPIQKSINPDHYNDLSNRLNQNGSFPSAMLAKVRAGMQGFDLSNRAHLDYTARVYGNMVEQDLLSRLRNGVYGNGVALAKKEEIYRIMLARALAKQHTQMLFVPIELMTYFALRFDEQGIGKSLLDDMKIINSLRSMLVFANVMASLKNSIGRTEVKIKLDEADPNPQKTIEIAMHEIVRTRQQAFPLGMNSPADLVDWLQRSGFEFTHEGHPGLPDVQIDFGEKQSNYPKPDTELEENLRKRSLMAMGLSPQTVDNGFNADFATSVVAQNLLLAKRVVQIQEQFEPLLNDHHHKVAMNSEELMKDLRQLLEDNFNKIKTNQDDHSTARQSAKAVGGQSTDDELTKQLLIMQTLREFVTGFEVSLPRPNTVTLENQLDALKKYKEALREAIESYISSEVFTSEFGGEAAQYAEPLRKIIEAYFVRQWMAENGMLTELAKLTTQDEDGKPMINFMELQSAHTKSLMAATGDLLKDLKKAREKSDKVIQDTGAPDATTTGSSSTDTGGGDFGDFGGGGSEPDMFGDIGTGTGDTDTTTGGEPGSSDTTEEGTTTSDADSNAGGNAKDDQGGAGEEGGEKPAGGDAGGAPTA